MSTQLTSLQGSETNEIIDIVSYICCSRSQKCFLCFKKCNDGVDIFLDVFVLDEQSCCKKSVYTLVTEVLSFNFREMISNKVCDSCLEVILKIYKMLKKYKKIKETIGLVMKNLDREIKIGFESITSGDTQCTLKLNLRNDLIQMHKAAENGKLDYCVANGEQNVSENLYSEKFDSHKISSILPDDHRIASKILNNSKICETCGKVCKSSALLRAHLNCHKTKKCPHCLKSLKTHTHFYYHVKRHLTGAKRITSGNTVYRCHDCDYTSKNKKSLEAHHNKEHLRIRPYTCDICSRSFYKQSNLVEHGRTHTKIKNDVCHLCGDTFVTKKCLREHLRLHTGEKPYKCDQCDYSFVSAGRRADHVKRKHWEKTELCVTCGKIFSLKKDLDRHVRNVHTKHDSVAPSSLLRDGEVDNNDCNSFLKNV